MECPKCSHIQSEVYDSRPQGNVIMRRRLCSECRHKFKTYEYASERSPEQIIKNERQKIIKSMVESIQQLVRNV